ncbi:MAG: hypothetical protein AABX66_02645 [Nanoarchaeota archaeon]
MTNKIKISAQKNRKERLSGDKLKIISLEEFERRLPSFTPEEAKRTARRLLRAVNEREDLSLIRVGLINYGMNHYYESLGHCERVLKMIGIFREWPYCQDGWLTSGRYTG